MPGPHVITQTAQNSWHLAQHSGSRYFVTTGELSDPKEYSHAETLWASNLGSGVERIVVPVPQAARNAMLKCFGRDESAASAAPPNPSTMSLGIGAVWGVAEGDTGNPEQSQEFFGEYLGRFDVTMRNGYVGSGSFLAAGGDAAALSRRQSVVEDRAYLPGLRTIGERGEASPLTTLDTIGYGWLIVELRCRLPAGASGTPLAFPGVTTTAATKLGFLYRFA